MFEIGRILEIIMVVFAVALGAFIGIKLVSAVIKEAFLQIKTKKDEED